MSEYLEEHWKYLLPAVALHAAIAALFLVTFTNQPVRVQPSLAIQAVVVDAATLRRVEQRQQRDNARERAEQERLAAAERERQEAQRRQQQEAEAARTAAAEREEAERQATVRQQAEAKQRAEAEAQRQVAEKARQAQAETERRAAAEKQRAAEIEKRQREVTEQRRAQEASRAQAAREAELKQQLAEETGRMQAESAGLNNQWAALIEQRVYRNWNRPATARPGIECQVRVRQAPGGTVLSAEVGECNGDAAVRESIKVAVERSSPLPPPPDPRLFQSNILLIFKPQD